MSKQSRSERQTTPHDPETGEVTTSTASEPSQLEKPMAHGFKFKKKLTLNFRAFWALEAGAVLTGILFARHDDPAPLVPGAQIYLIQTIEPCKAFRTGKRGEDAEAEWVSPGTLVAVRETTALKPLSKLLDDKGLGRVAVQITIDGEKGKTRDGKRTFWPMSVSYEEVPEDWGQLDPQSAAG